MTMRNVVGRPVNHRNSSAGFTWKTFSWLTDWIGLFQGCWWETIGHSHVCRLQWEFLSSLWTNSKRTQVSDLTSHLYLITGLNSRAAEDTHTHIHTLWHHKHMSMVLQTHGAGWISGLIDDSGLVDEHHPGWFAENSAKKKYSPNSVTQRQTRIDVWRVRILESIPAWTFWGHHSHLRCWKPVWWCGSLIHWWMLVEDLGCKNPTKPFLLAQFLYVGYGLDLFFLNPVFFPKTITVLTVFVQLF